MEEKFLGKILSIDSVNDTILIKADFLTEEKKEVLYDIFNSGKTFSFQFRKRYREGKTYQQIKTYFMLINQILTKLEIPIDKDAVHALDRYIMESLWPCKMLNIYGQEIPCVPSKSELSKEEFILLIQTILDVYSELNLVIESY
jgi:hypothetical protein